MAYTVREEDKLFAAIAKKTGNDTKSEAPIVKEVSRLLSIALFGSTQNDKLNVVNAPQFAPCLKGLLSVAREFLSAPEGSVERAEIDDKFQEMKPQIHQAARAAGYIAR